MSEITFREEDHTYWLGDKLVPGVTSLMKPLFSYEWINEQVLERKSKLGTAVHFLTEIHDTGRNANTYDIHPEVLPYFEAYLKFLSEVKPVWDVVEQNVFHQGQMYAGRLDRFGLVYDLPSILDVKCVAQVTPGAFVQCSAYAEAYMNGNKFSPNVLQGRAIGTVHRHVLQLKPDGTYRMHQSKSSHREDLAVFLSCLNIHRWKERHVK